MISISGNSLQELEEQLAELKRQVAQPQAQPQTQPQAQPVAPVVNAGQRDKLVELKRRTTRTTGMVWRLILAVAARQTPCTLEELKADLDMEKTASVHSLLAVLGRPCARLGIIVIQNISGNPTRYTMSADVRAIVTELG